MQINNQEIANIRIKPWWLQLIIRGDVGIALYPNFYVSGKMYHNLAGSAPNPRYVAVALHELEHLKRAKEIGVAAYYFHYVLNRRFRFEEEIACKKVEIDSLRQHGESLDIDRAARTLSGWGYFWCCRYQEAVDRLQNL